MTYLREVAGRGRHGGSGQRVLAALTSSTRRAVLVVSAGLLLATIGFVFAAKLTINSDFSKLLPSHYPSVQALDRLRAAVGGETDAAVAIESPSFEANVRFAEDLIPRVLALETPDGERVFTRVDYKRDTGFMERNALYLATAAELNSVEALLNGKIAASRLEANPFYFELEDDHEDEESDHATLQASFDRLVGREYPISSDSTTLVLRFYPGQAQTNIGFIEAAYASLQEAVDSLEPATYDAHMDVILAGRLLRQLVEVRSITDDVRGSFGTGAAVVLLMVVAYFSYRSYRARGRMSRKQLLAEMVRAPVTAAVIGLPLAVALCWTFGTAYLAFGSLNLMTSTLALVLFGLGIDYGIHFFGRYSEERGRGRGIFEAAQTTVSSTGTAVAVTAITTSTSFFVLTLADFRGFSEFGLIAGLGILYSLIAMVVFLPALLILFERFGLLNLERINPADERAGPRRRRVPASRAITVFGAAAFVLSAILVPRVAFEYDFGKLEPEYDAYQELQQHVRKVYDDRTRRNPAYVIVDDASEVAEIETALRRHVAADTLTPTVGTIETLQQRFPQSQTEELDKLERIADIRSLLDDPFLAQSDDEWLAKLRLAASTTTPVSFESIPEYVRAAFTARDGSMGRLVVIYPAVGLADGLQSMAFADDVAEIRTSDGSLYHAGSTSLVAADMLRLMQREAPAMVALTLMVVVGIKLVLLRSVRLTAIALLPLAGGFGGMFGLAALFGVSLNFYNLVVLPVILGIGDDAGIHLVHRYREEGPGSIAHVLRSTGEHVAMSALTTMAGFGGLLLSFHPGLRSIGILANLGIGLILIFAMIGLPAFIQYLEDRKQLPEDSQQSPSDRKQLPEDRGSPAPIAPHTVRSTLDMTASRSAMKSGRGGLCTSSSGTGSLSRFVFGSRPDALTPL